MKGLGYVALVLMCFVVWFVWQVLRRISAGAQAIINPERYAITKVEKMLQSGPTPDAVNLHDWKIGTEYYPDLVDLDIRLRSISEEMASAFRTRLLATKAYSERHNIARQMEEEFLAAHFGTNQRIVDFGRPLIQSGNKAASVELSKTVSVLGDQFDPDVIIMRIKSKYLEVQGKTLETSRKIAKRLLDTPYVEDAEQLIDSLNGRLFEPSRELFSPYVIILEIDGQQYQFKTHYDMTQWVIKEVVPRALITRRLGE